jgi:dephospho-CoA kinase
MSKFTILGIAGTNGSGKDTVGHILAEKHGYLFISVTELLRTEARRRELPVEREVLRTISAEWRRELGLGVLVDKAIAEYDLVQSQYKGLVMASLRNPGEADRVHDFGGSVIWLDADPRIRYDRIQTNAVSRDRAEEDNKTFEQFQEEEAAEMHSGGDAATLDGSAVKGLSDIFIVNGNLDITGLEAQLVQELSLN